MDQNKTEALPLKAAYIFGAEHGLEKEVDEIRDKEIEWDKGYTSTVRRGYILNLFEKHGVFDEFRLNHWGYGSTPAGEKKRKFYLRIKQEFENFLAGKNITDETNEAESGDEESAQQFAAESDLRDFLSKNLTVIEPGLVLYHDGDKSGVEFPIDNGFIDILAADHQGRLVVIELKVGQGRNKTVGQLLYYMGWIDKNLAKSPCRGMIIAKEIPDDLLLAVSRVQGVSVSRYHLSVSVEPVSSNL